MPMGDSERFATWDEAFRWLKGRGLKGVMFVVFDEHGGLTQAIAQHFQGATWQRGQGSLMRNRLSHGPVKVRTEVAVAAKLVLQSSEMPEARRRLAAFSERFTKTASKAVACLEAAFDEALAVLHGPRSTVAGCAARTCRSGSMRTSGGANALFGSSRTTTRRVA